MKRTFLFVLPAILTLNTLNAQKIDVYNRPLQSEPSHDYDAIHYRIRLRFDEEKNTFWGGNTITISPLKDGFTVCTLDAETFTVTGVEDEHSNPLRFDQSDHKLMVFLLKECGFYDTVSFTVYYVSENTEVNPEEFGVGKNYAIGLSFPDSTSEHPQLIQALSFPTGARHWYPCYDHPHDKATQEVIATVSNRYKVLSNGRLLNVTKNIENQTNTYHWIQEQPHSTYLSLLVAGPYAIIEDSLGDLPIRYWVYEKDLGNALRSFQKTPEIIAFFNQEYGYKYPWVKYDQITIPGIGGGAECTSATLIGQGTIHDEFAEQDFPSHTLVAHEAAHQWWGDLVTLRDWGHTWINESFATYSDYLFTKHDLGEDEGALALLNKKNQYLREAHNRYIRPIVFHRWNFPNNNFDSHTYPKGAVVLHMMRWIMGDTPFRATLSHFLTKHAFKPADTHDFLTAVKEVSGQNLDWFFAQWLYKPGHPVFEISYSWNKDDKKIEITVIQKQDTTQGIPIFKTPVIFGIYTKEGKSSEKVWLKKRYEEFEFDCPEEPLMVRFDEGNYLLKEWDFEKSRAELRYQMKNDDSIGRIWAASELSNHGSDPKNLRALAETAENDPFWAVRREAINTLSLIQGEKYMNLFRELCFDENSKVRTSAIKAVGESPDPEMISFLKERYLRDDSYVVKAQVIRSLGVWQDDYLLPFFREAMNTDSPQNIVRRAAEWAITQLDQ